MGDGGRSGEYDGGSFYGDVVSATERGLSDWLTSELMFVARKNSEHTHSESSGEWVSE